MKTGNFVHMSQCQRTDRLIYVVRLLVEPRRLENVKVEWWHAQLKGPLAAALKVNTGSNRHAGFNLWLKNRIELYTRMLTTLLVFT